MLIVLLLGECAQLRTHAGPGMLDGLVGGLVAWALVPAVAAVLSTGLILCVRTPWGLTRHWWIMAKCGIAAVLTVTGLTVMLMPVHPFYARCAAVAALGAATVLSVVKPWGRTPFSRSTPRRRQPLAQ